MNSAVRVWILPFLSVLFLSVLFLALPCASAQSQDDQPHIQPRDGPAPKPTPRPKQQQPGSNETGQEENQQQPQPPAGEPAAQESSSRDSQADFDAAPLSKQPGPRPVGKTPDDGTFLPWDPHRAEKDVEVGNYYLRLKNYRAALERFNDALMYKPGDAEATYWLAVTQEKLDLLTPAYQNYREYQKLLPSGPRAKDSAEAIKRIEPHIDIRNENVKNEPGKAAAHDIDMGETYLSMNRFEAARGRFEEAVRLAPENAVGYFRLAQSLQGLRNIESARIFYRKYLELDPHGKFAGDARKAIDDINAFAGK